MKQKYLNQYIFILMALLIVFAIFLQYTIVQSTDKHKNEGIERAEQYAQKIAGFIALKTQTDIESSLTDKPELRAQLNEVLQIFLTKQYQYIFLLKKDEKGHYRFLLDGSKDDPVGYKTIFFPQSELFDQVYATKQMQIVKQHGGIEQVWLSLVYPIVRKDQTQALLVLDLSESYGEHLNDFHSPLMRVVGMMQLFLIVSLLLLGFLVYKYYRFRKSILIDDLTSAYTKLYMEEFFNREKLDQYNAILMDIDEFKQINTKYGYESGDSVIKKFVETMHSVVLYSGSKIIRTVGTEFLVIVPKEGIDLEALAKKLFRTLKEKRYLIGNEVFALTVSMSAMVVPEETSSIQNVLRELDEKLLEIKSRGKNSLGILGIKHPDEIKYRNIDYIKEALEEERFCCLYQPIFNTKTKQIVKYEALVRLIDKEDRKKLISPFYFMKVIKGTSQYIKMSKLVLKEVFTTLHTYPNVELSVNLDLDDLYSSDMMKLITDNLYQYREIANRLTFEILEANEVQDYDRVALIFQQLKAYGSKIAIDDFGSGYANYRYLIRLDIDILKIDGSLMRELHTSPDRTKTVLASIKELASTFKYELVIEFVSDEEIYQIVKALGIEYSQGYYLGEPKPIEEYLPKQPR